MVEIAGKKKFNTFHVVFFRRTFQISYDLVLSSCTDDSNDKKAGHHHKVEHRVFDSLKGLRGPRAKPGTKTCYMRGSFEDSVSGMNVTTSMSGATPAEEARGAPVSGWKYIHSRFSSCRVSRIVKGTADEPLFVSARLSCIGTLTADLPSEHEHAARVVSRSADDRALTARQSPANTARQLQSPALR